MANEEQGRGSAPNSQLESDLIDYSAYRRRPDEMSGRRQVGSRPQAAGGFVPAAGGSRQGHHAAQGAYRPATVSAGQYARSNAAYHNVRHGMSGGRKAAIAIAVIAVIAAATAVVYFVIRPMFYDAKTGEMQTEDRQMELEALESELTAVDDTFDGTFTKPFTVLLLGSDARADDPDMGARTDTIVLCRVDTSTNTITMMSIPRDTMVEIEGVGTTKINAAYFYGQEGGEGGALAAVRAVKNLTGVDINYYAEINFEKLVGLIDAMGGIDVEVEERIDDPDAGDIVIEEGMQHLNGEAALVFSRSRAYVDGDYTRQRNQRKVIDAIINKGLTAPAGDLTGIIDTSLNFIFTTMSADFIKHIADEIRHNNDHPITIYSANIPSQPAYIGEVSYVIADTAGMAEMVRVFNAGGDISQPISASSIDADIANAGGSQTNAAGTSVYEEYAYNYQPETTYVQDTTAVDTTAYTGQAPVAADATTTYDAGAAGAVDTAATGVGADG